MMLAHWSYGLGDSGLSRELTSRRRGAVSEHSKTALAGRRPQFRGGKNHVSALGLEERAEFDADPGKLSRTSAVPPRTLDSVIIFGRSLISTSKKLLV